MGADGGGVAGDTGEFGGIGVNMALVFDPEWIQGLEARYGRRPSYQQPALYRVATQPEWAQERQKIEHWVSSISAAKQAQVINRLRDPDHFYTTYNELLVGDLLRQCGHQPEYERPLGGKTPDWFVPSEGDIPAFFVEVATIFPPEQVAHEVRLWDELRSRLEQIQHYFHLLIHATPGMSLAGKDMARIVRFVKEWLDSFDPQVTNQPHEVTYRDGDLCVRFTLVPRKTKNQAPIATGGPVFVWWVNPKRLRDALRQKLRKYRQAKELEVPLAIALVPTFDSGFGEDDLLDVLFGKEQMTVYFQNLKIVATQMGRDKTGIVTPKLQEGQPIVLNTRLSSVLWVRHSHPVGMKVVHNPYARFPLSPHAFPGFPNLVVVNQDATPFELGWVKA